MRSSVAVVSPEPTGSIGGAVTVGVEADVSPVVLSAAGTFRFEHLEDFRHAGVGGFSFQRGTG